MKKIITIILLFVLIGNVSAYEVDIYKGLKVNHIRGLCKKLGGDPAGCYYYRGAFKGEINIAWSDNEEHYQFILAHEYAHDIWWDKMTPKEVKLYTQLEKGRFDLILENKGILMGQCNVSDYAMTQVSEDFAETMAVYITGDYRKTIEDKCDVKILLTGYFYNKYTK